MIRREDANTNGGYADTGDGVWHYATDVLFSVVAVLDDTAGLQERVEYTPYGTALHHWHADFDGDRDIDSGDSSALSSASGNSIDDPGYKVEIDLNRDGTIDLNDTPAAPPGGGSALPRGWASDPDTINSSNGFRSRPLLITLSDFRIVEYAPNLSRCIHRLERHEPDASFNGFSVPSVIKPRLPARALSEGVAVQIAPLNSSSSTSTGPPPWSFDYPWTGTNSFEECNKCICANGVRRKPNIPAPMPNGCGANVLQQFLLNGFIMPELIACCNGHDVCYASCGSRAGCDGAFRSCMLTMCDDVYPGLVNTPFRWLCKDTAEAAYSAVAFLGGDAFCTAQNANCECRP